MTRVVIDPGVLLSALLSRRGPPARIVSAWLGGAFELVTCPALLDEVSDVLRRRWFRARIAEPLADAYVRLLRDGSLHRPDPAVQARLTPDPDDDYLVALAREARAHAIVSGDRHLVETEDMSPPVLTPTTFLGLLEGR